MLTGLDWPPSPEPIGSARTKTQNKGESKQQKQKQTKERLITRVQGPRRLSSSSRLKNQQQQQQQQQQQPTTTVSSDERFQSRFHRPHLATPLKKKEKKKDGVDFSVFFCCSFFFGDLLNGRIRVAERDHRIDRRHAARNRGSPYFFFCFGWPFLLGFFTRF